MANQLPSQDVPMGPSSTIENFSSRRLIMEQVMEGLEDDNIKSIGVFGMGGIGKTTLVTRIKDELRGNNRFKKIIMVTVPRYPDMKFIQDRIAEELGMKLEEQDMAARADKLCGRLQLEESVLIILDDVKKGMELGEIGLLHSPEHMPCKFIVTTKKAHVCSGMKVQKVIKIDNLSEDESWTLFEAKAGHIAVESPSFELLARNIVRGCKGSPLAISILGSTLSTENNEFVWAQAMRALENPDFISQKGVAQEVVTAVVWSFDHLQDDNVQKCFLHCFPYPKDCNIELSEMREYGIREGFLTMTTTLEDAHNELLSYIKILKDCCLLLDGDDESSVKMHEVVRDVALLIASVLGVLWN